MIELNRHIEVLLLENDCVIVPDFGGFMTHQVSARYDADDHSFLPPLRTLGFNPQLRLNDSLLVQSYVEAYDLSYPEALFRIEGEVAELKQQLDEEGCFVMNDLGTLTINQDGNYEFFPCEAGILSPELYGLSAFDFNRLKDEAKFKTSIDNQTDIANTGEKEKQPTSKLLEFTEKEDEDDPAIQIKMSWVRNAVAVAAAVVAFFFLASPIANSNLQTQTMSQLQHHVLYKLIPQDTNAITAKPTASSASPATTQAKTPEAPAKSELKKEAEQDAKKEEVSYCLVLASQVKQSNAELLVEKLHQHGYQEASIYIHKGVVRVIYGSYPTEADAYRQLNKLHDKQDFTEAWVYKKKAEV